jgi:hypothetical protein
MMTLDELIEELQARRKMAGTDIPVRVVTRRKEEGDQFEIIGVNMYEGLHSMIVLVFAGDLAATMDWPSELVDDKP